MCVMWLQWRVQIVFVPWTVAVYSKWNRSSLITLIGTWVWEWTCFWALGREVCCWNKKNKREVSEGRKTRMQSDELRSFLIVSVKPLIVVLISSFLCWVACWWVIAHWNLLKQCRLDPPPKKHSLLFYFSTSESFNLWMLFSEIWDITFVASLKLQSYLALNV